MRDDLRGERSRRERRHVNDEEFLIISSFLHEFFLYVTRRMNDEWAQHVVLGLPVAESKVGGERLTQDLDINRSES